MFPPPQFAEQGPWSPGAPREPPGPPDNDEVKRSISSRSNPPPGPPSNTPGRPPISLPTKRSQLPAEMRKTDVAGIVDSPPVLEISNDDYDADDDIDDSLDLGGTEGKASIRLKQMAFCLKQFANRIGQANYSAFNKWKNVWVAGFLDPKHPSIIWGQKRLMQVRDRPLHWETTVVDLLETFEDSLPLVNFVNGERIRRQWVEMYLKKRANQIWEVRKKGRWGSKWPATDLGASAGKSLRSNLPQLPNTMFMVVIRWVSNGNDFVHSPKQLQASFTDVRQWEELVDYINNNGDPKGPYILTSMFKCTLEQDNLDGQYMGLYTHGQMINYPRYGQISFNYWFLNAFKLKHGHNVKIFVVEMMSATGKEIPEQVIWPEMVFPASRVKARCAQLLIIIQRHWKVLKRVEERMERRMVGKRMIHVLI